MLSHGAWAVGISGAFCRRHSVTDVSTLATLTEKSASGRTMIPLDPLSQLHLSCGDAHIGRIGAWEGGREGGRVGCRTGQVQGSGCRQHRMARASAGEKGGQESAPEVRIWKGHHLSR